MLYKAKILMEEERSTKCNYHYLPSYLPVLPYLWTTTLANGLTFDYCSFVGLACSSSQQQQQQPPPYIRHL